MPDRKLTDAERKKQALRDNLKRRKAQVRELKGEGDLKTRTSGFSPKVARSGEGGPKKDGDSGRDV